jgi:hypothetical protein
MKTLFLSLILAAAASAQVSITETVPTEGSSTITFSSSFVSGLATFITSIPAQGNFGGITLTAPATATDTTFALSSATGLQVGHGLMIGSEVCAVTGVSPLVVARGRIGTTAAAYSTGQAVTVLRAGSYSQWIRNALSDIAGGVISSGPLAVQAQAAVTTAQAAVTAAQAAAVTGATK